VKSFSLPQYRPNGVRAPLTIAMSPGFNIGFLVFAFSMNAWNQNSLQWSNQTY